MISSASPIKEIKSSFYYVLAVIIGSAISFLALPFFTRVLTPHDYGLLALTQVYAVFASGLGNIGLPLIYERNFFQYREKRDGAALLYGTLLVVFAAFGCIGIITYIVREEISMILMGSREYAHLIFFSFFISAITSIKAYYLIYYRNTAQAKKYFWYIIDENILGTACSFAFVMYFQTGVVGMLIGQLVASTAVAAIVSVHFLQELPPRFHWPILRESFRLSLPLTPRVFLNFASTQFDKYILGMLGSIGGVGLYSIGQRVSSTIFTFMTAIQNVFAPQVYTRMFGQGDKHSSTIGSYLTPFAYVSTGAALFVVLFSEEIISLLTPPSYHDAIDITIVLSLMYALMFFGKLPQLLYAKKTGLISALTFSSFLILIAAMIPSIRAWGTLGAAWGMFIGTTISGIISFFVSQKYYPIYWEYRRLAGMYGILFVSAFGLLAFRSIEIEYSTRIIFKIALIVIYWNVGVRIGILKKVLFLALARIIGGFFFPKRFSVHQ